MNHRAAAKAMNIVYYIVCRSPSSDAAAMAMAVAEKPKQKQKQKHITMFFARTKTKAHEGGCYCPGWAVYAP